MEAFEKTEGDKRAQAVEQLKGACRAYIKHFVGEEKANELKKLKESGVSNDEMKKKVCQLEQAIVQKMKCRWRNSLEDSPMQPRRNEPSEWPLDARRSSVSTNFSRLLVDN